MFYDIENIGWGPKDFKLKVNEIILLMNHCDFQHWKQI